MCVCVLACVCMCAVDVHVSVKFQLCRSLDVEAQFTVNPSRASEITMAENVTATSESKIPPPPPFSGL